MNIFEKLEKLNDNFNPIYCTNSGYDILNLLKNKPMNYSIIYDHNIKYYIIGDRLKYVHLDLLDEAVKQGLYYSLNIMSYNKIEEYYFKEYKGNKLICFTFNPEDNASIDKDRSSDGYKYKYKFDFGNIFTRQTIDNIPLDFGKYEIEELVLNEKLEIIDNIEYLYNPTKSELQGLLNKSKDEIRGILMTDTDEVYVWNAYNYTHSYIDNKLCLNGPRIEFRIIDNTIYSNYPYGIFPSGYIDFIKKSRLMNYNLDLKESLKNNQKSNNFIKINERLEKIIESFN